MTIAEPHPCPCKLQLTTTYIPGEEPRPLPAVHAAVRASPAARPQGRLRDLGPAVPGRAVRRAVPLLLSVARPAVPARGGDGRARRTARRYLH